MGVLRGDLCFCDGSDLSIEVWLLKNYGIDRQSWTKLFTINSDCYGLYQPIHYFKNGALLMYRNYTNGLIYATNPESFIDKYLRLYGIKSRYEAIVHTPSFVSLKEIVVGSNVEILNVNSR